MKKVRALSITSVILIAMFIFALVIAFAIALQPVSVASANVNSVSEPEVTIHRFNTAISVTWNVTGSDEVLYLSSNNGVTYDELGSSYTEVAFPTVYTGISNCRPMYYKGKSYNTITEQYSSVKDLRHYEGNNYTYEYNCLYPAINGFINWQWDTGKDFPTTWNVTGTTWYHNGFLGQHVMGTISYKGGISNIVVQIPVIGYNKTTVSVGGATFELRAGPQRLSLRTTTSGVSGSSVLFAYGYQ